MIGLCGLDGDPAIFLIGFTVLFGGGVWLLAWLTDDAGLWRIRRRDRSENKE